jgi:superfamily II DNA or RNA helicase
VGIDCKHVAALARMFVDGEIEPPNKIGKWLASLVPEAPPPSTTTRGIVYLLVDEGRFGIRVMQGRRLKSGGIGGLSRLRIFSPSQLPEWIDRDEARRVLSVAYAYLGYAEMAPLASLGADLVHELADTGRLVHGGSRGPLAWGPARSARLRLIDADGDRMRLAIEPSLVPLPTAPPLYLDPVTAAIGPLALAGIPGDAPPAALDRLLAGPSIPRAEVATAVRSLRTLTGAVIEVPEDQPAFEDPPRLRPALSVGVGEPRWKSAPPELLLEPLAIYLERPRDRRRKEREHRLPLARSSGKLRLARDLVTEERHRRRLQRLLGHEHQIAAYDRAAHAAFGQRIVATIIPTLRAEGWEIEVAPDFPFTVPPTAEITERLVPVDGGSDWYDYEIGVEIDGETYSLLPTLSAALAKDPRLLDPDRLGDDAPGIDLTLPGGEPLHITARQLRRWVRPLLEIELRGLEGRRLRVPGLSLLDFEADDLPGEFAGQSALAELRERLASLVDVGERREPDGFATTLRGYQRQGLAWLHFLDEAGFGGLLADDMGLGKTVQLLALFEELRARGELAGDKPALVLAPRSVVENWRSEARRFAPAIDTVVHLGPGRAAGAAELGGCQLVLTSYGTFLRDHAWLTDIEWRCVVLDEAQAIKNPQTKLRRAVARLRARSRFCVTGTPIENHLTELWSQLDFLMPGLLGTRRGFQDFFRKRIEKKADLERLALLQRRIRPFMLRRRKADVDLELPPKTEIAVPIELGASQRDLYESLRLMLDKEIRRTLKKRGVGGSALVVLTALLRLRQSCCDPRIVDLDIARGIEESAKLDRLMEMLEELAGAGRFTLVFSQFTSMLALIEAACARHRIKTLKLTGQTRKREEVIARFQSGEAPVFLISLKAGGVGLNLTRADTVIHYDPWWNPAVEEQATDRAHRIGQDKPVFVYKLVASGSVEDRILELQEQKQGLSDATLSGGGFGHFTAEDIQSLFHPIG